MFLSARLFLSARTRQFHHAPHSRIFFIENSRPANRKTPSWKVRHCLGKSGNGAYLHKVFFWVTLLSSATVVRGGQVASTVYNNANITIIYFHLPSSSPSQLLRYFIPFVEYEREEEKRGRNLFSTLLWLLLYWFYKHLQKIRKTHYFLFERSITLNSNSSEMRILVACEKISEKLQTKPVVLTCKTVETTSDNTRLYTPE